MDFYIEPVKGTNYYLDTQPGSENLFLTLPKELRALPIYPKAYGHYIAGKNHFTRRSNVSEMCQIFYTISGEGLFNLEGKSFIAGPDTVVFLSGAVPHEYKSRNCIWDHEYVQFSGISCQTYYTLINPNGFSVIPLNADPTIPELFHQVKNQISSQDASQVIHCATLLIQIMDAIYYSSTIQKRKEQIADSKHNLHAVIQYIDEHYMDKLNLEDLASIAHLSKYYFCRLFKAYIGYTPHEYLINVRVSKAQQLLLNTNLAIDEIAWKTGFPDATNFVHIFKNIVGTTPGKYRHNMGFL